MTDPRPSLWHLAVLIFTVDSFLFAIPLKLGYSTTVNLGLLLWGLTASPGAWYALLEYSKVPETKTTFWVMMISLLEICIIIIVLRLGLASLNNMAASVGWQLPFYQILDSVTRIAGPLALGSIGLGAVVIRRKLPGSPLKVEETEPTQIPSGQTTFARYFAVTGLVLIVLSIYLGLFPPIAFEALVILVLGMVLLAVAFPIRWVILRYRSQESPGP